MEEGFQLELLTWKRPHVDAIERWCLKLGGKALQSEIDIGVRL